MQRRAAVKLGAMLFLCVTGCHKEQTAVIEKTVPAAGTVTYQGKPLEHYTVTFHPASGARIAAGTTDASGKFTLGTNKSDDGAVAGSHKVAIVYVGPKIEQEPGKEVFKPVPPPKVPIPEKFTNAETSGVTFDLPEAGNTDIKLELK